MADYTTAPRPTRNQGRKCRACKRTEARCAFHGGCCPQCSHFAWLDENGNEKQKPVKLVALDARPVCGSCRRRVSPRGRFDCPGLCAEVRRAYDRDRKRSSYRRRVS